MLRIPFIHPCVLAHPGTWNRIIGCDWVKTSDKTSESLEIGIFFVFIFIPNIFLDRMCMCMCMWCMYMWLELELDVFSFTFDPGNNPCFIHAAIVPRPTIVIKTMYLLFLPLYVEISHWKCFFVFFCSFWKFSWSSIQLFLDKRKKRS